MKNPMSRRLSVSIGCSLVAILGLALASYLWTRTHLVYTATALIEIRYPAETEHFDTGRTRSMGDYEFLRSANLLLPIIQRLKLDQTWAKQLNPSQDVLPPQQALDYMGKILQIKCYKVAIKRGPNMVELRWDQLTKDESLQISDDDIDYSLVLQVTVQGEKQQEPAEIANSIVDKFKAESNEGTHT